MDFFSGHYGKGWSFSFIGITGKKNEKYSAIRKTNEINKISSVEPLRHLTDFHPLDLLVNEIKSIEPIEHVGQMQELIVIGNKITSLESLRNRKKLTQWNISGIKLRHWRHLKIWKNFYSL